MATEQNVYAVLQTAGLESIEDRGIIVKYAPENLTARIADFFSMEFYVLQLCRQELALIPFSTITAGLKKQVTLQLPYHDMRSVEVVRDMLNDRITITTGTDTIRLTTQQKEWSDFRSTGMLAFYHDGLKISNWHKENYDGTLEALQSIGR